MVRMKKKKIRASFHLSGRVILNTQWDSVRLSMAQSKHLLHFHFFLYKNDM